MVKEVFLEKHVSISWIFVIIIAIFIFYISSLTFKGVAGIPSLLTYIYHFFIFFWLSFFLAIAMSRRNISLVIPALFISLFYALSDEVHQLFVPGRYCSLGDFFIDSSGIILACFLYLITIKIRSNPDKSNQLRNPQRINLLKITNS